MEKEKEKVLIVGATGYLGKRLVKASLALGHPTFILYRPESSSDLNKCQTFMEFKMNGARLLEGSLGDRGNLIAALRQVDVVISCIGSRQILDQLQLVDAIKEVGTIKRYLPSEFGMDVDRMHHTLSPGFQIFEQKRIVRRAIEEANIPRTYVSVNCFAGVFLAGLAQLANFMPPRTHVNIYGEGNKKCIWVDEVDIAMYTIFSINDPRTVNKVLYVRPSANILTQMEVVHIWEKLIGKELNKRFLTEEELLSTMDSFLEFVGVPRAVAGEDGRAASISGGEDEREGGDNGDADSLQVFWSSSDCLDMNDFYNKWY